MRRALSVIIPILAAAAAPAQTVSSDGWTVTAEAGFLRVSHSTLGPVLDGVRLNVREGRGLRALEGWSAERKGPRRLAVKSARPAVTWLFEPGPGALRISSTSPDAVLTATAPAPKDRVVARPLDPEGVPVDWTGTEEVRGTYGGSETRNPSALPRRNPDVMYFALGQVSGANLHTLFDRKTDTLIRFPEQTALRRNARNQDLLDVSLPVPGNALVRLTPDYYTKTLGVPVYRPYDDSYFRTAPVVWSSWTAYYSDVTERDIVRNADWLAQNLKPYGFEYVQLDDGYDRAPDGRHTWIHEWDRVKFPHGPEWLTKYIRAKGLRAGLWLVPNAYAGAVDEHPEWYLRDRQGKLILDYKTPALDSTNPEVLAFLRKLFTTLDGWGFDYYKFDGEHSLPKYAPPVDREKLYDRSIDPLVAYDNRLEVIREVLGPHRFVEGCPAGTPLNGIGFFNSYFNGQDVYNNWHGMHDLFGSINSNAFLNHMVVYVMPGEGIEIGPRVGPAEAEKKMVPEMLRVGRGRENPFTGFGVTLPEARTLVTYLSLTGVVYPLASIMADLPAERTGLLKMTLPTMPVMPVDLFSRGSDVKWDTFKRTTADDYIHNFPEILDLKVNAASGVYDVVGMTNWRGERASRELSFGDKLGLDPALSYIAFDYWAQKPLGTFQGSIRVDIEPHDTRVLLIRPVSNRPQPIGISRHITGAYSVLNVAWDATRRTLRGTSQGVPGEPYSIWIQAPEGATAKSAVPLRQERAGSALKITFDGRRDPVDWEVSLAN